MIEIEGAIDLGKAVTVTLQIVVKKTDGECRALVEGNACDNSTVPQRRCMDHGSFEFQAHALEDHKKIKRIPFSKRKVGQDPNAS